ncbi:hypothetical protein ABK040_001104 [Willaertia magna]
MLHQEMLYIQLFGDNSDLLKFYISDSLPSYSSLNDHYLLGTNSYQLIHCYETNKTNKIIFLFEQAFKSKRIPKIMIDAAFILISNINKKYILGDDDKRRLTEAVGIKKLFIVINDMDDINWDEKEFRFIKHQIKLILNFYNNEIYFIPVSLKSNKNLQNSLEENVNWYKGLSFIDTITTINTMDGYAIKGPLRVVILEVLNEVKENLTICHCKVLNGKIMVGQKIVIMPRRRSLKVIKLTRNYQDIEEGIAGEKVEIHLENNISNDELQEQIICDEEHLLEPVQEFLGMIKLPKYSLTVPIITPGFTFQMSIHSIVKEVVLVKFQRKDGEAIRFIKSGEVATAIFRVEEPICLEKYENFPDLGKFYDSNSDVYGLILKIKPLQNNLL